MEKAQAIRDQTMLSPSSYHDFRRRRRRRCRLCRRPTVVCVRFSLSFPTCPHISSVHNQTEH